MTESLVSRNGPLRALLRQQDGHRFRQATFGPWRLALLRSGAMLPVAAPSSERGNAMLLIRPSWASSSSWCPFHSLAAGFGPAYVGNASKSYDIATGVVLLILALVIGK
jgi:hypothetical protein